MPRDARLRIGQLRPLKVRPDQKWQVQLVENAKVPLDLLLLTFLVFPIIPFALDAQLGETNVKQFLIKNEISLSSKSIYFLKHLAFIKLISGILNSLSFVVMYKSMNGQILNLFFGCLIFVISIIFTLFCIGWPLWIRKF